MLWHDDRFVANLVELLFCFCSLFKYISIPPASTNLEGRVHPNKATKGKLLWLSFLHLGSLCYKYSLTSYCWNILEKARDFPSPISQKIVHLKGNESIEYLETSLQISLEQNLATLQVHRDERIIIWRVNLFGQPNISRITSSQDMPRGENIKKRCLFPAIPP